MFRQICKTSLYERKNCLSSSSSRCSNRRRILSILLFFVFSVIILRTWGKRMKFGHYNYVFGTETILEVRSSRFHNITVAQSYALRMLRFDMTSIQGVIHLEYPHMILLDYMRLQLLCLVWNSEPERILIIGLGVGMLPKVFHYLSPKTFIDIVEVDLEVVDLARKHFYFKNNELIRVYAEEGRYFIERQPSHQYDAIIIDAFTVKNSVPHALRTLECIGEYLRILKRTGLILASIPDKDESQYRRTFKQALLKHIYLGTAKKYNVLIGLHSQANIFNHSELHSRARILQNTKPLSDMNWIQEIKQIQTPNNDIWNASTIIFKDKTEEN